MISDQKKEDPVEEPVVESALDKKAKLAAKKKEKEKAKKLADKQKAEEQKAEGGEEVEKSDKKGKKGKAGKGKKPNMMGQLAQQRIQLMQEEEERIKKEEEEILRQEQEEQRKRDEENRLIKEAEEAKRKQKEDRMNELKKKGEFKTKGQIIKEKQEQQRRQMMIDAGLLNVDTVDVLAVDKEKEQNLAREKKKQFKARKEEEEKAKENERNGQEEEMLDDWEQMLDEEETKKIRKGSKQSHKSKNSKHSQKEHQKTYYNKKHKADDSEDELMEGTIRSPICCILGHVDTGKTTLLDKIRNTDVQGGEAGGITQQIGATYFPQNKLVQEVNKCKDHFDTEVDMPGLLIIDTPGHESFSNLRSRGSSLCDFAILVIDLMHGIEQQTLESIQLLTMRKTPFLVAVNKIDRIFKWKSEENISCYKSLQMQGANQKSEFDNRLQGLKTELAEKGFNTELYWLNESVRDYVSLVPTSGVTGEGIPDMLACVVKYTSQFLKNKITVKSSFNCTILEVTKIEGLGTTIDVILVNGVLREGDTVCLLGFDGPIVTTIRALLTPHPMKEMRVKNEYLHHKKIKAAMGIKISANNLDKAVAGSALFRVDKKEDIKYYSNECMRDLENVRKKIELSSQGVCVAASTLGSLEALLQFLKGAKIPVAYICVGNVSKDDVLKAMKNLLVENVSKRCVEYATVLAFDVKILPEAQAYSEQNGIKIITGNIIYHLFDKFTTHIQQLRDESKKAVQNQVIFPVVIKPVAFFNKKDPLVMGVDVLEGVLKVGTPLAVYDKNKLKVGVVESVELNKKSLKEARKETGSVAIRVKTDGNLTAGRQFDLNSKFVSILNRNSIDILKEHFRKDMTKEDWDLVRELKPFFEII